MRRSNQTRTQATSTAPGIIAATMLAAFAPGALARPTTTAAFTNGNNSQGWTFGSPNGFVDPNGGPGHEWFYHDTFLDTFAPQPRCDWAPGAPVFNGNWRDRNVTRIGIDLILFNVDFSAAGRPLTLMLVSDNGTPGNFDDDWAAYTMHAENVPLVGEGWKTYFFDVPIRETAPPDGGAPRDAGCDGVFAVWQTIGFGPNSPANPDWNALLRSVSQVRFFYGDPEFFFIFQAWDLGMDNISIRECRDDTNGDGRTDFFELNAVLGDFGQVNAPPAALSPGDVNGDGIVNFADLNRVLSRYGQLCG